ncbi:MAG: AAA family ATPase [Erythrobacter sp.]|nr:AAA family ATPase [Erythrobacter sp.]
MAREAAVALVGPRQVGKTTLALEIAAQRPSVYLDLERLSDREKLSDPVTFLNLHRCCTWMSNSPPAVLPGVPGIRHTERAIRRRAKPGAGRPGRCFAVAASETHAAAP